MKYGQWYVFFFFLLSSLCFSFPQSLYVFVYLFIFIVTDLAPKNMGPTPSHTRGPNKSPPLAYVRGSTKPTCFLHNCSFSVGIGFVIISYPFSSIWIFSRQNNFISSALWIQWYHTSICLNLDSSVKIWILTQMNNTLTITIK